MTTLPFSNGARVALAIARAIAPADGHADVAPLHVVIGILRGYENPAVSALGFLGVPLDELRRDLQRALPEPGRFYTAEPVLPRTPGEDVIVKHAATVAEAWSDEHIGAHHLMAAILRDSGGAAARVFADHGVTSEQFEEKVRSIIIKRHPPDSQASSDRCAV